jgi:hypothetical protein
MFRRQRALCTLTGHDDSIWVVAFAQGRLLAAASADKTRVPTRHGQLGQDRTAVGLTLSPPEYPACGE